MRPMSVSETHLAYQQSQEQLKEIQELLEALKSELATDATQSLQEELESLTEQLAEHLYPTSWFQYRDLSFLFEAQFLPIAQ